MKIRTEVSLVYFVECAATDAIKIGTTRFAIERRLSTLQIGCSEPLAVLLTIPGTREDEARLHRRFENLHVSGEWFRAGPTLRSFIDALALASEEDVPAMLSWERPQFPDEDDEEIEEGRRYTRATMQACFGVVTDRGVEHCARELTRIWGPRGRPVSEDTLRRTVAGEFSLRAEWLHWFVGQSETVFDALDLSVAFAQRFADGAKGDLARLKLLAYEQLGDRYSVIARRARAR